jgi:hypothetical protein
VRRLTVFAALVMAMGGLAVPGSVQAKPPGKGPTTLSFTGMGGAVPDGNAAGASFDIPIPDRGLIAPSGNNVTLALIGVSTNAQGFFNPYGGLGDFTVTLEHVGGGSPQYAFANVLNGGTFVCVAGLNGTYTFGSGEPTTLRSQCGTGGTGTQPPLIPPGTYRTTAPDDVTDSNLSSAWNSQSVAGTWRLHVTDTNVLTRPGQFVLNTTWTWRLDIRVAGHGSCKKGGWRRFTNPSFKNQGQCVAFMNHHNGKGKDDDNSNGKKRGHGKKK